MIIIMNDLHQTLPQISHIHDHLARTEVYRRSRLLPIALAYLTAGIQSLQLARSGASLSPWSMGVTFGGGHFTTAAVHY